MLGIPQAGAERNASSFAQLTRRRVEDLRVPRGQEPVFQFDLQPGEQVIGVDHAGKNDRDRRQTVDHYAYLWVLFTSEPASEP